MKPHGTPGRISLFAGLLALAVLSCSGAADIPNLFATDTPTPTMTFTPTPTFTPSPTSTPTQTPSPTPTPLPTGVAAQEQTDGTLLFIDHDNRYQLQIPQNWEIVFSSHAEMQRAVQSMGADDQRFAEMADRFKDSDPDVFRLAAMNVDRKYRQASAPTLLTINTVEDAMASTMPMAFVTAQIEDNLLADASATTWDVIENANGVEVGLVEGKRTFDVPGGMTITARELVIAFQSNDKLIMIEIVAPEEYQQEILSSFKDRIDTIKVETE